MWIEAPRSTRRLGRKVLDDDGNVVDVHVVEFNHNGRAEVSKKTGEFFLKDVPALKMVKDGGPPPEKESEAGDVVNEEEVTDV